GSGLGFYTSADHYTHRIGLLLQGFRIIRSNRTTIRQNISRSIPLPFLNRLNQPTSSRPSLFLLDTLNLIRGKPGSLKSNRRILIQQTRTDSLNRRIHSRSTSRSRSITPQSRNTIHELK